MLLNLGVGRARVADATPRLGSLRAQRELREALTGSGDAEVHGVRARERAPRAGRVGVRKVREGRHEGDLHGLPSLHVYPLEAEERLERHAAGPSAGGRQEPEHLARLVYSIIGLV